MTNQIRLDDFQIQLSALARQSPIGIDPDCSHSLFLQELQPFASPASHVQQQTIITANTTALNPGQIDSQTLFYLSPVSAKVILKRKIESVESMIGFGRNLYLGGPGWIWRTGRETVQKSRDPLSLQDELNPRLLQSLIKILNFSLHLSCK